MIRIQPTEMRKAIREFRRAEVHGFVHSEMFFDDAGMYLGMVEAERTAHADSAVMLIESGLRQKWL